MTEEITFVRACDKIPWGFRLTGGVDFNSPLTVSRITDSSVAEKRGLKVGDIITEIGGEKTAHLSHADAQRLIIGSKNSLRLVVLRGSCPDVARALTPVRGSTPSVPVTCNIEKKKTLSTASVGSVSSLFDDDSFEFLGQSDDDNFLEEKREPTEEQIEQMLLENAEVIEEKGKTAIGVNFHRFIPKCDFIKDSAVFQILQEEQVRKELSEKEQLQKCPNKRFSTFLLPPDRPVPAPVPKSKNTKEKVKPPTANNANGNARSSPETRTENERSPLFDGCVHKNEAKLKIEFNKYTTIAEEECVQPAASETDQSAGERNRRPPSSAENEPVEFASGELVPSDCTQFLIGEIRDDEDEVENHSQVESDYDKQLTDIKNTLSALGQLPVLIQSQLDTIQAQLNNLLNVREIEKIYVDNRVDLPIEEDYSQVRTEFDENETKKNTGTGSREKNVSDENENRQPEVESECQRSENEGKLSRELRETKEKSTACDQQQPESENYEEQEFERRHACPLTPLPRPVVLPGGRIWRKPKDAYNEDFIAETLISQAEVLVGSTLGVNFRKYETPKIDYSNSAVYKLVHDLDSKKVGLGDRDVIPALQDYYQSPISARHFYCASLAEKARLVNQNKNVTRP